MNAQTPTKGTLEAIAASPDVDSRGLNLDSNLLQDLHGQDPIDASVFERWDGGNTYSEMRVTFREEAHLQRLVFSQKNPVAPRQDKQFGNTQAWHPSTAVIDIITTLAGDSYY